MLGIKTSNRGQNPFVRPTPEALARHDLMRHLVLPGLAWSKPSLTHWACSMQAQAALDGALSRVWPEPKETKCTAVLYNAWRFQKWDFYRNPTTSKFHSINVRTNEEESEFRIAARDRCILFSLPLLVLTVTGHQSATTNDGTNANATSIIQHPPST